MYFLSINKLKKQIIDHKFEEKERFKYFIANAFLSIILAFYTLLNKYELIEFVFDFIILILTVISAYIANGRNKGKDFLGKFISIYFVLFLRFLFIFVIIFFLMFTFLIIAMTILKNSNILLLSYQKIEGLLFVSIISTLFSILIMWRIYFHIKDIRMKSKFNSVKHDLSS